jgi:hypothetical protein
MDVNSFKEDVMINPDNIHRRRGRPPCVARLTRGNTGCYVKKMELVELYNFWKKHQPAKAAKVDEITQHYLKALGWDSQHPRYAAVRDLSIRTVTRELLLMKIIDMDFTRVRKDAVTGSFVTYRACDQLRTLESIDNEISRRLFALGIVPELLQQKREKNETGIR